MKTSPLLIALNLLMVTLVTATYAAVTSPTTQTSEDYPALHRIWWNQPKRIEGLGLSEDQRKRMDHILITYLDGVDALFAEQKAARAVFGKRLLSSQPAQQKKAAADRFADAVATRLRRQTRMMIEATEVMTPEQRQALVKRYPAIFSRLWVRGGNPRKGVRRASKSGAGQPTQNRPATDHPPATKAG